MKSHVLLIDCEDRKGLVNQITGVLFKHLVNVESNDEFVDHSTNRFFMRTEFSGNFDSGQIYDDMKNVLPEEANIMLSGKRKKNIVVLATKEHHCIGDILIRHMFNDINANILAVISNHDTLKSLSENLGVAYHYVSHENLSREEHEKKVLQVVEQYNPDYIVLAKYMRILTSAFTAKFPNKIINIHHSFLPAFIGANPYRQAFERGVKIIGATAHFVNENLDEGPIIFQDVINISHTMDADKMSKAGKDVEKTVLSKAMDLVFDDRVMVNRNKTIIFN
ncbi:MAG: formyltetrahydrofolate deformylase [Spirochaetes bacterium]|nr:formyltetrahydrofolate deformylase [Spirochaetota bacterium]